MKKYFPRSFPLILLLVTSGCFLRPVCTEQYFIAHKYPLLKASLKTNGIYVSRNGRGAFFLYSNGRVAIYSSLFPIGSEFWGNPKKVLEEEILGSWFFNGKEGRGDYTIHNDSIIIQSFNYHTQEPCKRWVFEYKGKILSDSIILINSVYSYWGRDTVYKDANIYGFYPTTVKPDSTKGWVYTKKWYKRDLHATRKK